MFKILRKKNETPDSIKLEELSNILFPPPKVESDEAGNKYHVDYSIDYNLEGALIDIEMGHADRVAQDTIRYAISQLAKARKILQPSEEVDEDVKYFIVDNLPESKEDISEQIRAKDEPL